MFSFLSEELIADIGESVGFQMWSRRDKSIEYGDPGARGDEPGRTDDYHSGNIICTGHLYLLVFSNEGYRAFQLKGKSEYTLNLHTLKPTAASPKKNLLSDELKARIKSECIAAKTASRLPSLRHSAG
jgi:hypothetical protein